MNFCNKYAIVSNSIANKMSRQSLVFLFFEILFIAMFVGLNIENRLINSTKSHRLQSKDENIYFTIFFCYIFVNLSSDLNYVIE